MTSFKRPNFRLTKFRISEIFIYLSILQLFNFIKAATILRSQESKDASSCKNICTSLACFQNAQYYNLIMKPTLDPCNNFYAFACGNFYKKAIQDSMTAFDLVQFQAENRGLSMIIKDIKPNDLSAFQKMKIYYKNCVDEKAGGVDDVLKILKNIGGWPLLLGDNWNEINFDWKYAIYKLLYQKISVFFPVVITIIPDKENPTKFLPKVLPTFTEITNTFFSDDTGRELNNSYRNFAINVALELGADKSTIDEEVNDIVNFEICLYKIKKDESMKQLLPQRKMTLTELSEKYPSFTWLELFNNIFNPSGISMDGSELVIMEDVEYIQKLAKLLEITPKRVLANYLGWRVVRSILKYMPREYRKLEADFSNQAYEIKESLNRSSMCLHEVMKTFSIAFNAMYIQEYLDKSSKNDVKKIVNHIKKHIQKKLEKVSWMDKRTRKSAIKKLKAMSATIGYPDALLEEDKINGYYEGLEINPGSYLISRLNISSFLNMRTHEFIRRPFQWRDLYMEASVAFANAQYAFLTNSIEVSAGFLQGLFFQRDRPQYLNYGAMGTIIGHEITHAFDDKGRKYDKNGHLKNWWELDTEIKYLEKAQCFINQYSNFTVNEVQLQVDGNRTLSENIADNGGFKAAYFAYKEWAKSQRVSEGCLPNLNYTPQQMFWISAASSWCSIYSSESLRNLIMTDVHSPDESRVIVPFSNIKEFSEDFQCKPNSRMNPNKKCVLW